MDHRFLLALANTALLALALSFSSSADAYGNSDQPGAADSLQYTFAWKFLDGDAMAPRGGTTRGPQVTLAPVPTATWQALQATPDAKARDRAAIVAMAGTFRTSFDFVEVAGFSADFAPSRPYQSWATERVIVIEDSPDQIVLQHILVMRFLDQDGKVSEPMVIKHWRQDWRYEPEFRFEYLGDHRWQQRAVPVHERAGAWAQDVYQVDDSPRYSGVGRWSHSANYSSWIGGEEARPLPRREWSVRQDYALLVGTNRHTITPNGWIHEQQNNKLVSATDRNVVAREFGLNRYEAISDELSAADTYWAATAPLWAQVRARWTALLALEAPLVLKAEPDRGGLFMPLFEAAQQLSEGQPMPSAETVQGLVDAYLAEAQ